MAFTLHWPNACTQRYSMSENEKHCMSVSETYNNRLCSLTSGLSLQTDVLFPNADASARQLPNSETPAAIGCVGNQLDNSFPLESRTPVALPLLMYPTRADGACYSEQDMCALPVLNWEEYIRELSSSMQHNLTMHVPKGSQFYKWQSKMKNEGEGGGSSEEEDEESEQPAFPSTSTSAAPRSKAKKGKRTSIPLDVEELLTVNPVDVSEDEKEPRDKVKRRGHPPTPSPRLSPKRTRLELKKRFTNRRQYKLPLLSIRKYMKQPPLKVMGTWNYLYHGTGGCNWTHGLRSKASRTLFVGNGPRLRMISLKPSKTTQMLSYVVESVWEEAEVPSNVNSADAGPEDALSDLVFEIKTLWRRNQVAVRRGKSVEVYVQEDVPSLVASIPNVSYGNAAYAAMKASGKMRKPNPFLTSFDMNAHFPSQLVTMDENAMLQFIDIEEGKVVHQVEGLSTNRAEGDTIGKLPQLVLNDYCGVAYAGAHPDVVFYSCDSNIFLYDRRLKRPKAKPSTIELFNLRTSPSYLSMCDQDSFKCPTELRLREQLASFLLSQNPLHYYLGTTAQVLLMDVRVPNNPIVKLNHGLVSPPAFMDVIADENYEVLVAGSQRDTETFCAVLDTSHLSCSEREGCEKRNPILHSYPKHLSNARDYFDFAHEQAFTPQWETHFQRAKAHCQAWTTGHCLMKSSKPAANGALPPSFILFNTNSFGDVFLQEWDQAPVPPTRKVDPTDKRLNSFLSDWKTSMTSPIGSEPLLPPSSKTSDFSLIVESAAESLRKSQTIRLKPFDSFTPHALVYHRVRDGLPSFQEQIASLGPITSQRVQDFLNVWTEEEREECEREDTQAPLPTPDPLSNDDAMPPAEEAHSLQPNSASDWVHVKQEVDGIFPHDDVVWQKAEPSHPNSTQPHSQAPSPHFPELMHHKAHDEGESMWTGEAERKSDVKVKAPFLVAEALEQKPNAASTAKELRIVLQRVTLPPRIGDGHKH